MSGKEAPDVGMQQRSDAWFKVIEALDEVSPGWMKGKGSCMDKAVKAIKKLAASAPGA